MKVFLLLIAMTLAVIDQAPCVVNATVDNFMEVCQNQSLATSLAIFPYNDPSGTVNDKLYGFDEWAARITYYPLSYTGYFDSIWTTTVCKVEPFALGRYCDNCTGVNRTSGSSIALYCNAIDCTCIDIDTKQTVDVDLGEGFISAAFMNLIELPVDFDSGLYQPFYGNQNPFNGGLSMKRSTQTKLKRTSSVYISFKQPTVTITPSEPTVMFIWFSILSNNELIQCNNTCAFDINDKWLITTEILTVTVYVDDIEVADKQFNTTAITFCPIPNNPFSEIWVQSWNCMGIAGKFALICGYLGFAVVMISLIVFMFKFGWCLYERYSTNVYVNVNTTDAPVQRSLSEMVMDKVRGVPQTTYVAVLLISFCFTISATPICLSSVISQSKLSTCSISLGLKTCSYDLNIELALSNVGASACIDLTDDNGDTLRKIVITYSQSLYQVSLRKLYYTSDWRGIGESKRICAGSVEGGNENLVKWCGQFNNLTGLCLVDYGHSNEMSCQGYDPMDLPLLCSDIADVYPGQSYCILGSNKGCGPFDFSDAYLFGKYAYLPIGPIFKVSAPDYSYLIPKITIDVISDNVSTTYEQTFEDSTKTIGDMTFEILGELTGSLTLFGSNKIITGTDNLANSKAYYGSACEQNAPCIGNIGDIQSSFDSTFHTCTSDLSQFIYPINAVQPLAKDGAIDFKFPRRGLFSQLPVLTEIPSIINGDIWTVSNDMLIINSINPGQLLMKVSTSATLSLTENINTFCPIVNELEDVYLVGCSNCVQGLVVNLIAHSTCESGLMDLSLECSEGIAYIISRSCLVQSVDTQCQVRIRPSSEIIKCDIIVKGTNQRIHFNAMTPELETVTNTTGTSVINTPSTVAGDIDLSTDSITNGFLDWFNGLDGWKAGIKWTVIAVIGIILTSLFLYLVYLVIKIFK
jgi:hypothetical protein